MPGVALLVEVTYRFELTLSGIDRRRSQCIVIHQNLNDYYRRFNDAVPDVSNMFFDRSSVTPFISRHFVGVTGGEYYAIRRMKTGDAEYHGKVFLLIVAMASITLARGKST